MYKLLPIFIFSILMAYMSDRYSSYEFDAGRVKHYIRKEKLFLRDHEYCNGSFCWTSYFRK